jgi:hypothetical protein
MGQYRATAISSQIYNYRSNELSPLAGVSMVGNQTPSGGGGEGIEIFKISLAKNSK